MLCSLRWSDEREKTMNQKRWMAAATVVVAMASGAGHAQTKTCRAKLVIDSVYQKGLGSGKYEYFLQIRNATDQPLHWQLNFKDLPSGVRVERSEISGQEPLAGHASKTLRFGAGTNAGINVTSVSIGYDVNGKNITASNCY